MITTIRRLCNLVVFLLLFVSSNAQELRAFNQNSARSNHGLSISVSPVYSSSTNNSRDSLLFRGNGSGFRVGGDYFFGKTGIGLSTGFSSSSTSDAAINNFLKNTSVPPDQLLITKAKQQNMYLLIGPSLRFGNKVELYAHAKAGVFINNSGLISIQQKGAVRAAYRNESTDKNMYPGFLTGLSVQYKTKSDVWSFGLGADYMNTKSEVNNYDARRGGGIEALKLSGNIQDIVAGISVRYNILAPRDHASGQSTGKRQLGKPKYEDIKTARDAASGMATGKRLLPTVNKREIAIDEPGVQRTLQSCGTVTKKITNPDGTIEEMTFSCPKDAADYAERTRDVTNDPGTIWSSSDKRENSISNADGSRGIVSGRLTWMSLGGANAIVTNNTVRGGSLNMNSQSSSTRQTQQSSFGTMVRLSAREAGSGLATGKRQYNPVAITKREAGSGLATGRRQYEPIFDEQMGEVCNPCLAEVKSNPVYKGDMQGAQNNPLYNGKERVAVNTDEDCDGIAGIEVSLISVQNGAIISRTKTEQCGDFFFANVPEGNYVVKVAGVFAGKKGYDVYLKSKTDLQGDVTQNDGPVQLMINTSSGSPNASAINTSHSNIKNLILIEADLDGDGEFESTKVLAGLYDGTTKDITAKSRLSTAASVKKVTVRGWDPEKKQAITGSASTIKEYTISIDNNNEVLLTTRHENGTKEEEKVMAKVSHHSNVVQFVVPVGDPDNDGAEMDARIKTKSNIKNDRVAGSDVNGDGFVETDARVKTKSNIKNDRVMAADISGDGLNTGRITKSRSNIQNNRMINEDGESIWSPRSNIKILRVATGDVDGDGRADMIAGNKLKSYFENGDIPTESQRKPGEPIPGIDVKLGKNPGGQAFQNSTSNADGKFEFAKLEAGDYFITVEQNIIIDDETLITITGNETAAENINTSESNLKDMTSKTRDVKITASQNSQSLKQTGPQKWMAPEVLTSILIEADLDGDGEFETNVSNKISDQVSMDKDGKADEPQQKAGISTSRSNIRTRGSLVDKGDGIFVCHGTAIINDKEVTVKIVYKSSHDMPMNAIRNLKG